MKPDNEVTTEEIEYTRTVVPSSMRSPYWRYFGFPSDNANNILTRQKIVCTLCNKAIAYNKNTSNLRTHLIARHPALLLEIRTPQHDPQQQQQHIQQRTSAEEYDISSSTGAGISKVRSPLPRKRFRSDSNTHSFDMNTQTIGCDETIVAATATPAMKTLSAPVATHCTKLSNTSYITTSADSFIRDEFKTHQDNIALIDADGLGDSNMEDNTSDRDDIVELIDRTQSNIVHISTLTDTVTDYDDFTGDVDPDDENSEISMSQPYNLSEVFRTYQKPAKRIQTVNSTEAIVEMLITDLLPISLIDGNGFQQLLHFGHVDKKAVERRLSESYDSMYKNICQHLHDISEKSVYSLSIECHSNMEQLNIIYIYMNYLNVVESNEMHSILYYVSNAKDCHLENIFENLKLDNCAAVMITPNVEECTTIMEFLNEHHLPVIHCFAAILTQCLEELFQETSIADAFDEIYKSIEQTLSTQQQAELMNVPDVYMPCPWSKLSYLQYVFDNLLITNLPDEMLFHEMQQFVEYIGPLKITLETIAEEPLPVCSLMRPLIMKLFDDHFSSASYNEQQMSQYIIEAKRIIEKKLTNSILKSTFLNEATYFDVRFHHDFVQMKQVQSENYTYDGIPSTSPSSSLTLKDLICKRFKHKIEIRNLQKPNAIKQEDESSTTNGSRKSNLKSFFKRLTCDAIAYSSSNNNVTSSSSSLAGGTAAAASSSSVPPIKTNVDVEFERYQCEPTLDLEQCPLKWWQENIYTYKQLHKLANCYLSLPCCVNTLYRYDANERRMWLNKRSMLRQQCGGNSNEKHLWYLHYNQQFCVKLKMNVQ